MTPSQPLTLKEELHILGYESKREQWGLEMSLGFTCTLH